MTAVYFDMDSFHTAMFQKFLSMKMYIFSQTAPVDKVLFLKARATGRNLEVATLITSEGGNIRFWCLYGARHEMGKSHLLEHRSLTM